ncbi:hypothetical protein [Amycolatopsis sp. WQ 127309]|uniref:hypothetical protein n=1 Tax=Amycolatopsis sp. WQ 127309 TaxID=2932773 RepID=UPI001FF14D40|nr:hypothetical protein [Amycolatopsis sp. WQ 127309]UOZ04895.1 hypothetical protein MUY22_39670 [Amycolatopsis sp. WQ 127309]
MPNRVLIAQDTEPIPCEACGQRALYVARLVTNDGATIGQTMVCTACRRHRAEASAAATR